MNVGSDHSSSGLPEDRHVPTPEELIGSVLTGYGEEHRLDGIEAIGSKFVVYRVRNVVTNEVVSVAKVPLQTFDPREPLAEALPLAAEEVKENPDRVIRICERLLALDPTLEPAAFYLGIARFIKQDITGAVEALGRAVSLAPEDLMNLLHRASCFAALGRDEECLQDFIAATKVSAEDVRQVLTQPSPHPLNIRAALGRLSNLGPAGNPAMRALEDYF